MRGRRECAARRFQNRSAYNLARVASVKTARGVDLAGRARIDCSPKTSHPVWFYTFWVGFREQADPLTFGHYSKPLRLVDRHAAQLRRKILHNPLGVFSCEFALPRVSFVAGIRELETIFGF